MSGYTSRIEALFNEIRHGLRQKFEARIPSESDHRYELLDFDIDDVDAESFQITFAVRCSLRNDLHTQRVALAATVGDACKNLDLVSPIDSTELQDLRNKSRKKEADFWEEGKRYGKRDFSESDFAGFALISPRGATVVQSATFGRSDNIEGLVKMVRKICEIVDEELKEIKDLQSPLKSPNSPSGGAAKTTIA